MSALSCTACKHAEAHHATPAAACEWDGCGCPRFLAPPPVQHGRIGPGKCACGYDAYKVGWGMVDYGDLLYDHIRAAQRRQTASPRAAGGTS